jgi:hypothetical protein
MALYFSNALPFYLLIMMIRNLQTENDRDSKSQESLKLLDIITNKKI